MKKFRDVVKIARNEAELKLAKDIEKRSKKFSSYLSNRSREVEIESLCSVW